MTLFELELGVRRVERRDVLQGQGLRAWLSTVVMAFDGAILPVDDRVATSAAGFHAPDPAPDRDAFIASTARVHGLVVVTRNVRDFERFDVRLLHPWS